MKRVTWILGAGFSRSLGGPLLADLFSSAFRWDRNAFFERAAFPKLYSEAAEDALCLYKFGLRGDGKAGCWSDSEEFLEQLDEALAAERSDRDFRHGDRMRQLLAAAREVPLSLITRRLQDLCDAARVILAAECAMFLEGDKSTSERWLPYTNWARQLDTHHTLITFNYDLVLEKLRDKNSSLLVRLPGDTSAVTGIPILKLHGSLDWEKDDVVQSAPRFKISANRLFALNAFEGQSAIASPGPTKRKRVSEFQTLWQTAEESLSNCDAVVFLGYGELGRVFFGRLVASEKFPKSKASRTVRYSALFKLTGDFKQGSVFWKDVPLADRPVGAKEGDPNAVKGSKQTHHGAGFGDPLENTLVEAAAIRAVKKKYQQDGWSVRSVERDKCGFDLECTKNRVVENVEVKGVRGSEPCFIITAREVERAGKDANFYLMVVTSALSQSPKLTKYSGAEFCRRFEVTAIQYRAVLRS